MSSLQASNTPASIRPRLVSITGWLFFGIGCWMTLGVCMYLAVSGFVPELPTTAPHLDSGVWRALIWIELILGPAIILTSLRFLRLRRWTRIPMVACGGILALGCVVFGAFWVIQSGGFFKDMRSGPPMDGVGSVVVTVFQVVMTIGGVAVSLAFAGGFWLLVKRLNSKDVRESVTLSGF